MIIFRMFKRQTMSSNLSSEGKFRIVKISIKLVSIPAKELDRKVKKEKNCSGVIKNEKNKLKHSCNRDTNFIVITLLRT